MELDRTRSVARLDRDGLVLIELGSNDNRVRVISITEAGVCTENPIHVDKETESRKLAG